MKKGTFKVSFVEPQIGQLQEQQLQEQWASNREEDQHQAVDIRWHTVNQPKRKWKWKKEGLTTTSNDAVASASAGNSIDVTGRSLEPPVDPPNYQTSLQPIAKKGSSRLQHEAAEDEELRVEPAQGRKLRSRRTQNLENT